MEEAESGELNWDALYADHAPRVYNYFRFRVGGADVEDLTSRTFEKAWRSRARSCLAEFQDTDSKLTLEEAMMSKSMWACATVCLGLGGAVVNAQRPRPSCKDWMSARRTSCRPAT